MKKNSKNLIWIDLEMTGLDTFNDKIIEIATIVTDKDLNILEEGPVIAINTPQEALDAMDEWNTNQHNNSGLFDSLRVTKINIEEAEKQTIEFLNMHAEKGRSPLCGNTISHDRRFLRRYMPEVE